jgi:hypothetical protein
MTIKHMYQPKAPTTKSKAPPPYEGVRIATSFERSFKRWGKTHLLEPSSGLQVARNDLEICSSENPACNGDNPEYHRERNVDFEGEDEIVEQGKTPDDQVQADGRVVLGRRRPGRVRLSRIGRSELQDRQLERAKREPEDGKQCRHHHGKEVPHDPLEDCGEDEKHGACKEEYAPRAVFLLGKLSIVLFHGNRMTRKGISYTTGEAPFAPPHPINTMAKVKVDIAKLNYIS